MDPNNNTPPHITVPGYTGPERRTAERIWRDNVDKRFSQGAETMAALRADLDENTQATKAIKDDTAELVEFFRSMQGAFKVFNALGALARPLAALIGLGTAIWGVVAAIKTGVPK